MINVVAGIIEKDGKILIARRAEHKSLGGKWEFPGGKIEKDEQPEKALERELLEEFDIQTKSGKYFATSVYEYPTFKIRLIAYYSSYVSGEIKLSDHDRAKWVDAEHLWEYDFADADVPFVSLLSKIRT